MDDGDDLEKRHLLLIDGGNIYERLTQRLSDSFRLQHLHCPSSGLSYANSTFKLDGIVVDLVQGPNPSPTATPSLLGLWVVNQLREFTSCSNVPIAVVSHWPWQVVEKAASASGVELLDCEYFQMSNSEAIVEYFLPRDQ
jgi:hypothetical protein